MLSIHFTYDHSGISVSARWNQDGQVHSLEFLGWVLTGTQMRRLTGISPGPEALLPCRACSASP